MKKKLLSMLLICVLLVSILLTGCGSKKKGASDVTMAFCTWTGYSPMFIALEYGYFE